MTWVFYLAGSFLPRIAADDTDRTRNSDPRHPRKSAAKKSSSQCRAEYYSISYCAFNTQPFGSITGVEPAITTCA